MSQALLERFGGPGPRYTSYPTTDRFVEAFGPADCLQALWQRAQGARVGGTTPLSIYVHVPFCESVCHFCACDKIISRNHERAAEYVEALDTEIKLVTAALGQRQQVSQIHFGGGSPTFLSDAELDRVMASLRRAFRFAGTVDMSIEVDPRTVTPRRLDHLAQFGFEHISFGVQDFDPQVQRAVHRMQDFESVRDLMKAARDVGFESINADLMVGLPRQTPASFALTVTQMGELRPDRISLYAYDHRPQRFKPQRRIAIDELPSAPERVDMLRGAIAGFLSRGYSYIGMDHFALPGDALARAKRQGRLHRTFQGYSTQPEGDLIGLGMSAIGRIGASYHQNAQTLPEYFDALRQGLLPVARGIALNRDDIVRRAVIMALMCQGRVEFESIELAHLIDMRVYFRSELERLLPLAEAGLIELEPGALQLTPAGWYQVRSVARVFDRYRAGT